MSSAGSICFYKIKPHWVHSKFIPERSSVNSCNCYLNLKKENKQNTAHKYYMRLSNIKNNIVSDKTNMADKSSIETTTIN